eukprot:2593432-Rhodomonas_salina.1
MPPNTAPSSGCPSTSALLLTSPTTPTTCSRISPDPFSNITQHTNARLDASSAKRGVFHSGERSQLAELRHGVGPRGDVAAQVDAQSRRAFP